MCESVCVSVSVGEGRVKSTWGRADTQSGGGRPGVGKPVGPLAVSLSLFLCLPYLWFPALDQSWRWGVCVCVCVCVCVSVCLYLCVCVCVLPNPNQHFMET